MQNRLEKQKIAEKVRKKQCPVCNSVFDSAGSDCCPVCDFYLPWDKDESHIKKHKRFFALSDEQKNQYNRELDIIVGAGLNIRESPAKFSELDKKYHLLD